MTETTSAPRPPLVKILDPKKRPFWNIVGESLVVAGLAVSISLASYIVWEQYTVWRQRQLVAKILPSTIWAQKNIAVYLMHLKDLWRINIDGSGATRIFSGSDVIRECVLSPDRRSVVIRVGEEIYWIDSSGQLKERVDALDLPKGLKDVHGSLSGIQWDRESKKFLYKVSRWSPVASSDAVRVYDVQAHRSEDIPGVPDHVSELAWDWEGRNLYFVRGLPTTIYSPLNKLRLYRIPLDTKTLETVATLQSDETALSRLDLESQGVKLYIPKERASFKKIFSLGLTAVSPRGKKAGLDSGNFIYMIGPLGKPKRILELPWASRSEFTALDYLEWVPGERYLLLLHRSQGLLIFDTISRKVGRLIDLKPQAIGWAL